MIDCMLSDPAPKMLDMSWHPWRALRALHHVIVEWEVRPGVLGSWDERESKMTFHPQQSQRQRRVTVTHELIHLERGDDGHCDEHVELLVKKETARRCIPIRDLVEAVLFYGESDTEALAEELWVDPETVVIRLNHLHPAERGYLLRRLSMKEHTA